MTFQKFILAMVWSGLFAAAASAATSTIISDTFNIAGSGTGFSLNTGVNTGINPPTTRLTGAAKANLRYIQTGTGKASTAFAIASNKLQVDPEVNSGRFVLSDDGTSSFDFGPALGISAANATNRIVYDLSIRMNNNSPTTQRFSVGFATAEGDLTTWDFGVQIYRTNSGNNFYTLGKRIDTGSSGLAADLNEHITSLTENTFGNDITVLIRVTDAGSETTTFNSRVQLSLNGGNSWFYDTQTDSDLTGSGTGFRFNGSERHIIWDVAGDAGPVTYDAFSLKLNPPLSNVNTSSVIKVMSYNMHFGAHDGKVNTQDTANFILDQRADLVSLNEVDRFRGRSDNRDIIGELAKETGMTYVYSNCNTALTGNDESGNAILSKYPVLYRSMILLPNVGDNEQRGLLQTVIDVNGKFICFWSTHLDFHDSDNERLQCVTKFNEWITNEVFPVIIGGDFNDTPAGAAPLLMEQKWNDIWDLAGDGTSGQTVPCPGPTAARIDYLWKSKGSKVTPTGAYVGSLENSDHYPVLTQFILDTFTNHAPGFYFPFDEASGTKVTDVVGKLSGTLDAAAPSWSADSPSGQAGDASLYFNGTKRLSIVDTNQIIGTNGMNDNYTLQAWVKLSLNYVPFARAILFQYDRSPGFSFSINTNRTLHTTTFKIKDINSSAAVPNDGKWHHVAVVHNDGANMKFYVDAALAATVSYTSGAGYRTSNEITMGSADDGANPFTGYLDRVKFDNRPLTPAEFDFPAIPPLGIRRNGSLLTVFWPGSGTNYTLQANSALQTNGWATVASQLLGVENQASIVPTNKTRYFRLNHK